MSATVKLNSGYEMPLIGFGLWKVDNSTCADTVYNAIKVGYRLFDGACDYGNEVECGRGVARAIKDGLVKREDLFIVSKLWNTFHDKEHVGPIARKQLADWGLEYFDLFLIHFPVALAYVDPAERYPPGWFADAAGTQIVPSKATIQETWQAMETLVHDGVARSIGVSNFQAQLLYDLLRHATIKPATLQVEHHPYLVQPLLLKAAAAEGVTVTAYSSFGPAGFVELDMARAKDAVPLLEEPTVVRVAQKYGKTPAQVLLRWATQRGVAVIPKSSSEGRMKENLESGGFDMTEEEIEAVSQLDKNLRFNQPTNYFPTDKLWIFG